MPDINIRNASPELYWKLKQDALTAKKTLREYCIELLSIEPKKKSKSA
jgi:hypothetical protein